MLLIDRNSKQTMCNVALLFSIGLFVGGCGADSSDIAFTEKLTVSMLGDFTVPFDSTTYATALDNTTMTSAAATGNSEPKNQVYTLSGVTAVDSDSTTLDLFTLAEAESSVITVVDRSQIIFEADLTDFKNSVIESISLTFAATGVAKSPGGEELTFSLPASTLVHTEQWTVTSAVEKRLKVLAQWKYTINVDEDTEAETVEASSFTTELIDE